MCCGFFPPVKYCKYKRQRRFSFFPWGNFYDVEYFFTSLDQFLEPENVFSCDGADLLQLPALIFSVLAIISSCQIEITFDLHVSVYKHMHDQLNLLNTVRIEDASNEPREKHVSVSVKQIQLIKEVFH